MKPTKANLECADLILRRNRLQGSAWYELRRDIAIAITLAEREAKARPVTKPAPSKREF